MMIARGNELAKLSPVTKRLCRVGAVGPILGNHLLPVREIRAEGDEFFGLLLVFRRSIFEGARLHSSAEVVALGHSKGRDEAPLRASEHLQHQTAGGIRIR